MKRLKSKKLLNKTICDTRIIPDLSSGLIQCSENTFRWMGEVKADEIVITAQAILKHQLQYHPILLNNIDSAKTLAMLTLSNEPSEIFCVMFLDHQSKLIRFEKMFRGTVNQSAIYPREIARRALELNAVSLILIHNHPSGDCRASVEDECLTHQIKSTFAILDIKIVDHFIIGNNKVFSLAENGKL